MTKPLGPEASHGPSDGPPAGRDPTASWPGTARETAAERPLIPLRMRLHPSTLPPEASTTPLETPLGLPGHSGRSLSDPSLRRRIRNEFQTKGLWGRSTKSLWP